MLAFKNIFFLCSNKSSSILISFMHCLCLHWSKWNFAGFHPVLLIWTEMGFCLLAAQSTYFLPLSLRKGSYLPRSYSQDSSSQWHVFWMLWSSTDREREIMEIWKKTGVVKSQLPGTLVFLSQGPESGVKLRNATTFRRMGLLFYCQQGTGGIFFSSAPSAL